MPIKTSHLLPRLGDCIRRSADVRIPVFIGGFGSLCSISSQLTRTGHWIVLGLSYAIFHQNESSRGLLFFVITPSLHLKFNGPIIWDMAVPKQVRALTADLSPLSLQRGTELKLKPAGASVIFFSVEEVIVQAAKLYSICRIWSPFWGFRSDWRQS